MLVIAGLEIRIVVVQYLPQGVSVDTGPGLADPG
jgi:hypothetical protein